MRFDPILAETRFGYGLSPSLAPPRDAEDMLAGLQSPDAMAARFEIEPFERFFKRIGARRQLKRRQGQAHGPAQDALRREIKAINRSARRDHATWLAAHLLRRTHSPTAFRERLEAFWANHFTAMGKSVPMRYGVAPYVESALRPHLAGRFADLLRAAVTHPLMLHYLDQKNAVGPLSAAGEASGRGLNENLAREVLELHSMGVSGPYDQADVRALAELFTGLSSEPETGLVFRSDQAQPGPKTLLGQRYTPALSEVMRALDAIARHPATARHICTKLARHFIADTPPPDLCTAMTAAFLDTDGDLSAVYRVLLTHPTSWQPGGQKLRSPFGFVASLCRSLGAEPARIEGLSEEGITELFAAPLAQMGQAWLRPPGPDGFADSEEAWRTPQGMAARLNWALRAPQRLTETLPDPRRLPLPDLTPPAQHAVAQAESRAEGLAILFVSPAFQRV